MTASGEGGASVICWIDTQDAVMYLQCTRSFSLRFTQPTLSAVMSLTNCDRNR